MQDVSTERAEVTTASNPVRSRRRRLDQDQQREVARLYAETSTPTAEIRKQFDIGESSLYRILERLKVPLRGRGPAGAASEGETPRRATRAGRRATPRAAGTRATTSTRRAAGTRATARTAATRGAATTTAPRRRGRPPGTGRSTAA